MHEFSMTQRLMELVLTKANQAGAEEVIKINLAIGDSSGLVAESILSYFDYLKKGTIAEQAELYFREIPTLLRCRECHIEYEPPRNDWNCPQCGDLSVERLQGGESFLESLEVS